MAGPDTINLQMKLSKEKIEYFKKKLEEHKLEAERELANVARRNLDTPGDWETTPADMNVMPSDKNELADTFEELENRAAIEDKLEERLTFINQALERVKKGTYGICENCKEPIDEKRLEAYSAAKNCIKHSQDRG